MKLKMPNGDIVEVQEGQQPEQAIEQWKAAQYAARGADPNMDLSKNIAANTKQRLHKWSEQNPVTSRAAAYQSGAKNLGRGLVAVGAHAGNALGLVGDDTVAAAEQADTEGDANEQHLKDSHRGYHMAGEILPTLAVPMGGGGIAAKALATRALPRAAAKIAAVTAPRAIAEGAVYGAATEGTGGRTRGAATGAVGGAVGNALSRVAGRVASGAVPKSGVAARLQRAANQTPGMDGKMQVPANLGGKSENRLSRGAYNALVSVFPGGRKRLNAQLGEMTEQAYESILRQSYGKYGDEVVDVFRAGNANMDDAVALGEKLMKEAGGYGNFYNKSRSVLKEAVRSNSSGNLPSFEQVHAASKKMFPNVPSDAAPFKQLAADMQELLGKRADTVSPLVERAAFYAIIRKAGGLVPAVNMLTTFLANPRVQNVLTGDTKLQRAFLDAVATGRESAITPMLGRIARNAGISALPDTEGEEGG